MSCCPPGSHGKASGTTTTARGGTAGDDEQQQQQEGGKMIIVADAYNEPHYNLPCYVTGAPLDDQTKRVVIICTDVFGIDTGRHKQFADDLASCLNNNSSNTTTSSHPSTTTTVIIPDFFRGKPLATLWLNWLPDIVNSVLILPQILWNLKFRVTEDTLEEDLLERLLPWIRNQTNNMNGNESDNNMINFSVVGFCFGGWWVGKTLSMDDVLRQKQHANVVCGVGIHPSFQVERSIYGRSEESLAETCKGKPILLLPASNDDGLKPNSDVVQILANNALGGSGIPPDQVSIEFPNMKHGWVIRGDGDSDPEIRDAQERALQLTCDFINKYHPVE